MSRSFFTASPSSTKSVVRRPAPSERELLVLHLARRPGRFDRRPASFDRFRRAAGAGLRLDFDVAQGSLAFLHLVLRFLHPLLAAAAFKDRHREHPAEVVSPKG